MQSTNQYFNLLLQMNPANQIQLPVLIAPQIFTTSFGIPPFQNLGGTFLENIRPNQRENQQEESEKNQISKETLIRRSNVEKKTNWSAEEDEILKYLVEQEKLEWAEIVKRIPNRTYKMCYSRYQRIKEEKKVNWAPEQENKIKQLVSLFGKRWKHISQLIPNRTPKQIRERYLNYLRPNISHQKWSTEEDLQLLELIKKYGHRWKTIERHMSKRSQNQLKNRFYGKLKKLLDKGNGNQVKDEVSE